MSETRSMTTRAAAPAGSTAPGGGHRHRAADGGAGRDHRERRPAAHLCVGTAIFGMFFFLTIFVQTVWGYSALRTGIAYLPMMATVMLMSVVSAQLVPRIGARPLLLAGSAIATGGLFWLSRISEHSHYTTGLL